MVGLGFTGPAPQLAAGEALESEIALTVAAAEEAKDRASAAEPFMRRARIVRLPEEPEGDASGSSSHLPWRGVFVGVSALMFALAVSLALAWRRRRFFETA